MGQEVEQEVCNKMASKMEHGSQKDGKREPQGSQRGETKVKGSQRLTKSEPMGNQHAFKNRFLEKVAKKEFQGGTAPSPTPHQATFYAPEEVTSSRRLTRRP